MTSVLELLQQMQGVWVDHLVAYHPNGEPMLHDPHGGSPGPFPYDNLVYCDVDGATGRYRQTNVTFRGRPLAVRSFAAGIGDDGLLRFDRLGPEDPGHVGVSGGPGVLWFTPDTTTHPGLAKFSEPDHIRLLGAGQRTRVTTLFRRGALVRTMTVTGSRVADDPARRLEWDPRGADGPVHEPTRPTQVFVSDTGTNA